MKKINIPLLFIIISAFSFLSTTVRCQEDGYNAKVEVIGDYTPTISDAFKINQNPQINDSTSKKPALNYYISSKKIETPFNVQPVKAAKMLGEPLTKLYSHLIKAGFGNYTTPYFEYFYNNTRSREVSYGLNLKHFSSSGEIKDYAFSGFSDNQINLYGKKFMKNYVLTADVNYERNAIHYYGYNLNVFADSLLPDKNDIKQQYFLTTAKLKYFNIHNTVNKLNYKVGLSYYNYSDYDIIFENNINFTADINKNVQLIKFTESQNLGLLANVDFYNNKWDSLSLTTNNAVVKLMPYLSTSFNKFNFKIGINSSVKADTVSTISFYPLIEMNVDVIKKILILNVGISGGMEKANYKTFNKENPFTNSTLPLEYTNNKIKIFGGIISNFSKDIDFNASVSLTDIEHMPFFVNDTNCILNNRFTVIYDDVQLLNAKAEISYQKSEKLKLLLGANYYNYSDLSVEMKAWQKPNFDLTLSAIYNLKNKIIIKADIFAIGERYAKTYNDSTNAVEASKINGIFDINLGIEYRYSKIWSCFVNFNNITGNRYYLWNNYPSYRFHFLAGLTYAL